MKDALMFGAKKRWVRVVDTGNNGIMTKYIGEIRLIECYRMIKWVIEK